MSEDIKGGTTPGNPGDPVKDLGATAASDLEAPSVQGHDAVSNAPMPRDPRVGSGSSGSTPGRGAEQSMRRPTLGRTLHYRLSKDDAAQINRRRISLQDIKDGMEMKTWPAGAQAHVGGEVYEGETFPLIVTRVFSESTVSGQVLLDGSDVLWVKSVNPAEGEGAGWFWPPLV